MIRARHLGFLLLAIMMVIFFVIPGYEGVQKPFRIALCLSFPIIYFSLLIKKEISYNTLLPVAGVTFLLVLMAWRGTLQSSFVNAWFCLFGLLCIKHLYFDLTKERKENLCYIFLMAVISILLQFLLFRYEDGRPNLAYQFNLSGAYLFLFFIVADILDYKLGKLLVFGLSLLMVSRLLIASIVIFYLVRFGKKYFTKIIVRINAITITLICFALFSIFSIWYTSQVRSVISYESGYRRIIRLNDGSNGLRFSANTVVLKSIFTLSPNPNVIFGYGSVENFVKEKKIPKMPHNELFDAIVEFGLLSVFFFSMITLPAFNRIVSFANLEYFIPILFSTLILWVRYLLIPNPDMLFILLLLFIAGQKNNPVSSV